MKKHTLFALTLSFLLLPFALTGAGAGGAAAQTRALRKSISGRGISGLDAIKSRLKEYMDSPKKLWDGTIFLTSTFKEVPIVIAAIEKNDIAFLQMLFKKSKESNIEIPTYLNRLYKTNLIDDDKVTPLHLAIEKMDPPLVRLLLEHGADASLTNPLDLAFRKALAHKTDGEDHAKLITLQQILIIIEVLLDSGANINAVNPDIVTNTLEVIDKIDSDLKEKIKRKLNNAIDEKAESKSERMGAAASSKTHEPAPGAASEREDQHKAASEEKAQAMRRAAMTMPTPPGTGAGGAAQTSTRAIKIAREFYLIKSLVEQDALPEPMLESIIDGSEEPLIIAAIEYGELDLLNLLFNRSNKAMLKKIINKTYTLNDDTLITPLELAIAKNAEQISHLLLTYGAEATGKALSIAFSKAVILKKEKSDGRMFLSSGESEFDVLAIIEILCMHKADINSVDPYLVQEVFSWLETKRPDLKNELEKEWIPTKDEAAKREQEQKKRKQEKEQREKEAQEKSDLAARQLEQEAKKEEEKEKARAKKEAQRAQKQAEAREKQLADAEQKRQEKAAAEKRKKEQEQAEKKERRDKAEAARLKAEEKQREKEKADRDKHEQEKLAKIKAKKQERKQRKLAKQAAVPGEPGQVERGEGEPALPERQIEGEGSEIQPGLVIEPELVVEPGQPEERKEPIERKERKEEAELKGAAAGPAALRAYARPKSDEQLRKEHEAITFLRNYKNGPSRPDIRTFHTYALLQRGAPLPNDFYLLLVAELVLYRTDGRLPKILYKKLKADGSCNWFKDDVARYSEPERTLRLVIQRAMKNLNVGKSLLKVIATTFADNPTPRTGLERLKSIGCIVTPEIERYVHYEVEQQKIKALRKRDGGTLPVGPEISSLEELRIIYPS